jgi:hypothetical protein
VKKLAAARETRFEDPAPESSLDNVASEHVHTWLFGFLIGANHSHEQPAEKSREERSETETGWGLVETQGWATATKLSMSNLSAVQRTNDRSWSSYDFRIVCILPDQNQAVLFPRDRMLKAQAINSPSIPPPRTA